MKKAYVSKEIDSIECEIGILSMSFKTEDKLKVVSLKKEVDKLKKKLDK
jgi:hypothetical protein